MTVQLASRSGLELKVGDADRLLQYANNSEAKIEASLARANSEVDLALRRWFTDESVDALTAGTVEVAIIGWTEDRALGLVIEGNDAGPASIKDASDWAVKQFSYIATGNVRVAALTARASGGTSGGFKGRLESPRVFDPTADNDFTRRFPIA